MASIGDVAAALRAAIALAENAARAAEGADDRIGVALASLQAGLAESSNPLTHDGLGQWSTARERLAEALALVADGAERMGAYVASIAGGGNTAIGSMPTAAGAGPRHPESRASPGSPRGSVAAPLSAADARSILTLLPGFERKRGSRSKTRGILRTGDGSRFELVSGADDTTHAVREHMWNHLGAIPRPHTFGSDSDVELKAALKIAESKRHPQHADVVINNPRGPCEGDYGCDSLLPKYLPPGSTLTVHWPGGEDGAMRSRTYTGTTASETEGRTA